MPAEIPYFPIKNISFSRFIADPAFYRFRAYAGRTEALLQWLPRQHLKSRTIHGGLGVDCLDPGSIRQNTFLTCAIRDEALGLRVGIAYNV